jgi:hypothetical protein
LKPGDLVKYVHWDEDFLLKPLSEIGIILIEPNEVGNLKVLFGTEKKWVWSGDIKVVKHAVR